MPRGLRIGASPDPLAGTALYAEAIALSVGGNTSLVSSSIPTITFGSTGTSEQDFWEWQAHGHFDALNGIVHVMGKPQAADESWAHRYYTLSTNSWTNGGDGMWNNFGHIYGNIAIDPLTGDFFCVRGGMNQDPGTYDNPKRVRWWKKSTNSWGTNLAPVSQDIYASGLADNGNGVVFHPNLYGVGDGGLIISTQFRTLYWRKSTDAVDNDGSQSTDQYGAQYGVGVYWPELDAAILGGAGGNSLLKVVSNGTSTPTSTDLGAPIIPTSSETRLSGSDHGSLHVHPGDPTRLILVEHTGSKWYTTTNGSTWTRQDTTHGGHPFSSSTPFTVVSLPELGCLWALGYNGAGNAPTSVLWKPNV